MRCFCLVCPEITGEQERAKAYFDSIGLPVEFIQGIHGATSGLVTTHLYEVDHPGSGYKVGTKISALCLSHILAWTACSVLPDDTFLILESDAKFIPDWKARLEQAVADLPPDWDMLYVGSCNCDGKPREHVKGDVYRMSAANPHDAPQCTHAILYNKKAIPVVLRTQRKIYTGIDLSLIYQTLPLLNVYVVLPRIAEQWNTEISP